MNRARIRVAAGVLLAGAAAARAADPAAAVDEQYAAVTAAMKKPSATGVLVTEVGPGTAAAEAGIRGGDILVSYRGSTIQTLAALRAELADAIAQGALDAGDRETLGASESGVTAALTRSSKVLVGLRRAGEKNDTPLVLQVKREPLGIRAIEVEAGVRVAGNPPPSLRGSLKMGWDEVILNNSGENASDGGVAYFVTTTADGADVNWQRRTMRVVGENEVEGSLSTYRADAPPSEGPTETVTFQMRGGDYQNAPAFLVESVDVTIGQDLGQAATHTSLARRAGLLMKTESPAGNMETAAPLDSAVGAALPLVAAAMPHEKDAVLPVRLMSVRDFVSRPGYVLNTRGKVDEEITTRPAALPATNPAAVPATRPGRPLAAGHGGPPAQLWRVDLQHCGVIVESYWFSDDRKLVRSEVAGGTPLTSRRVVSEDAARGIVPLLP
jgi:hypothetical protein